MFPIDAQGKVVTVDVAELHEILKSAPVEIFVNKDSIALSELELSNGVIALRYDPQQQGQGIYRVSFVKDWPHTTFRGMADFRNGIYVCDKVLVTAEEANAFRLPTGHSSTVVYGRDKPEQGEFPADGQLFNWGDYFLQAAAAKYSLEKRVRDYLGHDTKIGREKANTTAVHIIALSDADD